MKKKGKLLAAAVVILLLLCGTYFWLKPMDKHESILIGGSSTAYQYTIALAEEYQKENEGVSIYCERGGSTPGLIAVKKGAIDIAAMSRDLEAEEDEEDLNNYLIGKDGVGIIVHPSNPLSNLTIEQVKDVFSGVADNWSILGGDNSNIMVVGRDPESTTYKGLNEIILKGAELPESAVNTNSADEMIRTVAANPAAIGFVALKDLKENVKALDINGVQMNKSTILTDRYPISRSFYFVIFDKPDSRSENRTSSNFLEAVASLFKMDNNKAHYLRVETIMDFLDFVKSDRGQKIIEKDGAIAVY